MSNLVDRLNNEHPNYLDAIAAADKIQELQIDLNILKRGYHVLVQKHDALKAENEKLRLDAERYRWLTLGAYVGVADYQRQHEFWCLRLPKPTNSDNLDVDIDAARAASGEKT